MLNIAWNIFQQIDIIQIKEEDYHRQKSNRKKVWPGKNKSAHAFQKKSVLHCSSGKFHNE